MVRSPGAAPGWCALRIALATLSVAAGGVSVKVCFVGYSYTYMVSFIGHQSGYWILCVPCNLCDACKEQEFGGGERIYGKQARVVKAQC